MPYEFATVVVTTGVAVNLRNLSKIMDRFETDGMFLVPLSASGNVPATHYISTGMVPAKYVNAITDGTRLFTIAKKAYEDDGQTFPFTQNQVNNALAQCTYSAGTFGGNPEGPFALMTRLGLKMIRGTE